MEIVFIRHAEAIKGFDNPPLTEKGIEQSIILSDRLGKEKWDEFYCSNMVRAKQTASYVSKKIGIIPLVEPCLDEFNSELLRKDETSLESEVKLRYSQLRSFLLGFSKRATENKRILIIAHGITNRLILATLLELETKNLIRFRQLETAINEVYWVEKFGNWRLKYWDDVSHQPRDLVEGLGKY